jgi:hypothetical protein
MMNELELAKLAWAYAKVGGAGRCCVVLPETSVSIALHLHAPI